MSNRDREDQLRESSALYERARVAAAVQASVDARMRELRRQNERLQARLADAVDVVARLHGELEALRRPVVREISRPVPIRRAAGGR